MEDQSINARPRLVADIGGTNARFALINPGARHPTATAILACADYPSLHEAVEHYLGALDAPRPREAVFAVATAIEDDQGQDDESRLVIFGQRDAPAAESGLAAGYQRLHCASPGLATSDTRSAAPDRWWRSGGEHPIGVARPRYRSWRVRFDPQRIWAGYPCKAKAVMSPMVRLTVASARFSPLSVSGLSTFRRSGCCRGPVWLTCIPRWLITKVLRLSR